MVARRSFVIALTALVCGCASTPEPRVQADPPIDFSSFRTYEWAEAQAPSDPWLSDRARTALAQRLGARGLTSGGDADIAVAVSVATQARKQVTDFGDDFFIPGHGPHPGIHVPGAYPRYDVRAYTEGQLSIAIYDARTRSPLWRGVIAAPLDPTSEEDLGELVDALLARAG
jgi:hypothetical protein